MIKPYPSLRSNRASALLSVIIFGVIISISAGYAYRSTMYQNRMAARSQDYLAALNIAEAGAELAMVELNKSANRFSGWSGTDPATKQETITDPFGTSMGDVSVRVIDVGANPKIIATGYIPNKANSRVMRTVQLTTKGNTVSAPWGEYGLFSFGDLNFSGGQSVNSFDPVNPGQLTNNANIASTGNINFNGTQNIKGNVQAGGNVNVTWGTSISGSVYYGGYFYQPQWHSTVYDRQKTTLRNPEIKPLPVAPVKSGSSNNNGNISVLNKNNNTTKVGIASGGALNPANSDITLPAPGTYHFSSVKPSGTSSINIVGTGEVKIFVDSDFDMSSMAGATIRSSNSSQGPNVTLVAKNYTPSNYANFALQNSSKLDAYADKITFSSGSKMSLEGDSAATFTGKTVNFSGGAVLNVVNGKPGLSKNFIIYASEKADLGAGASVSGVFYGPNAKTTFSGGMNWWGAVIGKDVTINGGPGITIDQTLFTPSSGSGAYVTAWSEVAPKKI